MPRIHSNLGWSSRFATKSASWYAGLLLAAVALAGSPQIAMAEKDQDSEIKQLAARVAELEALVQQLVAAQASVAVPESMSESVPVREMPEQSRSGFGGYIKADAMFSKYSAGDLAPGSAGTQFYIPATIPVGGVGGDYDANFQARESRINFRAEHETAGGNSLAAFIEMDFFLSPGGDDRISNSYNPRLRHAFAKFNNWTVGQTWTTFQDVGVLPDLLDFIGPSEGTVFGRQGLIRYTNGAWELAAENPDTTITPFGGGEQIVTNDGAVPDLVARYTVPLNNGYIKIAGLARSLHYDTNEQSDSEKALGLSLSGKHEYGMDDLRWMATIGSGTGRYLGLNTANDAVLDANGNLDAIDEFGGFVAYRHFWRENWRSSITLSYLSIDNDTDLTGLGVTKDVYSVHANLLFEPIPKLTIGGEVMYAERETEGGLEGGLTRFLFSTKYGF